MSDDRKSDEEYGLKIDKPQRRERMTTSRSVSVLLLLLCVFCCVLLVQQAIYVNIATHQQIAISAVQVSVANSVSADIAAEESRPTLVNINTADVQTLCTLKGIGESKAKAIIEYRTNNGLFTYKEELMKVSGIGEKTYASIAAQIVLSDESTTE